MTNANPASQGPTPQPSTTPKWRKLLATALTMLIAVGVGSSLVGFMHHDRIYLGRPLGRTVIRVQEGTQYRRLGTGTYVLRRTIRNRPDDDIANYDVTADVAYRAALPATWEDITWPERISLVAAKLPHEKWPSDNRICWSGAALPTAEQAPWVALPYQQSHYNTQGLADRNYRGFLLIFERSVGGSLILDVFKRRQGRDNTPAGLDGDDRSDWARVKDYIVELNHRFRPELFTGQAKLTDLKLPAKNPLCLGAHQLAIPKTTNFKTRKSGFYYLTDAGQGLEAYVGYRNARAKAKPDEDLYDLLRQGSCHSDLNPVGGLVRLRDNRGTWQRYQRVACDGHAHGILATIPTKDKGTITLDVFTKRGLERPAWKRLHDYLAGLQQGLHSCDTPRAAPSGQDPPAARPEVQTKRMPATICSPLPPLAAPAVARSWR